MIISELENQQNCRIYKFMKWFFEGKVKQTKLQKIQLRDKEKKN